MPTWARVSVLGLLVVAVLWHGLAPLAGYDLWWVVATGRELFAQGHVLRTDPFSHTVGGQPWPYYDAGGCLLFFGLFELGGPAAIVVTKALVYLATMVVLYLGLRAREIPPALISIVLGLVITASAFRFNERLQIFSFLILAATLLILDQHRRGKTSVFWVVALVVVNVNLHRGGLVLPIVVIVHALSLWSGVWTKGDIARDHRPRARAATLAALACAAACLATPFGIAIVDTSVAMVRDPILHGSIPEWWPITIDNVWRASPASFLVGALVVAALVVSVGRLKKTELAKGRTELAWDVGMLLLAIAVASRGLRFLPYLALIAALPIARALDRPESLRAVWRSPRQILLGFGAAVAVLGTTLSSGLAAPSLGVEQDRYPDRAIAFVREEGVTGRMYNDFSLGGYLIWELGPEHPVFIDGRNDIVYPQAFIGDYIRSLRDPEVFARLTHTHEVEWLLLENHPDQMGRAFVDHDDRWALVHFSQTALVYVRREGRHADLVGTRAFEVLRPHDLSASIAQAASDPSRRGRALEEAERMVAEDPQGLYAHIALAKVYVALGPKYAARRDAQMKWLRSRGMGI